MWISKKAMRQKDEIILTLHDLARQYAKENQALLQALYEYGQTIDELDEANDELREELLSLL